MIQKMKQLNDRWPKMLDIFYEVWICGIILKTIKRLIVENLWLSMGTLWIVLSRGTNLYNAPVLETMLLEGKAEASSNILSYE